MLALIVAATVVAVPPEAMMARYLELTRADAHCARPNGGEIVVCARRTADRYRVPLVQYDAGDPRHEAVMAERTRLLNNKTACQERGPFLIGCGMVGVGFSTRSGLALGGQRPLAP